MRLVLRLGLVSVAVVALAACGSSASPAASSGGAPSAAAPSAAATSAGGPTAGAPSAAAAACQTTTNTAGGVAVAIQNFSFNPGTINAKVGQAITFTNQDNVNHGAALDDGSCTTGAFGHGSTGSLVFSAAGTYTFHCPVHHTMTGTIEVKA